MSTRPTINVLIVDDSRLQQKLLQAAVSGDPGMTVVGVAANGHQAVEMAKNLRPDVISMDVVMPECDGIEATRLIMARRPTPIVLVTSADSVLEDRWAMRALTTGALAAIQKPDTTKAELARYIGALRAAAAAAPQMRAPDAKSGRNVENNSISVPRRAPEGLELVLVACSAGGPKALARLLAGLPKGFPVPILLVQHISGDFRQTYVEWLRAVTQLEVVSDSLPMLPQPGTVIVAPADAHLVVTAQGLAAVEHGAPINRFRPSATELFRSATSWRPAATLGIVLSGMGSDGFAGVYSLLAMGGTVWAQDAESCIVYGMPAAAVEAGATTVQLEEMNKLLRGIRAT